MKTSSDQRSAFTVTDLLVLIAILALLAVTQLPALTGGGSSKLTQCMNNCRQMAQATELYKADNKDKFPHGARITNMSTVTNLTGWPMQLLRYMGGYTPSNQPAVYACPSESLTLSSAPMQLHFQANRNIICDINNCATGIEAPQLRRPSVYWMFIEKHFGHYANISSGALITDYMIPWNSPGGLGFGMRRHNGGMTAIAADGHVDWLRMPAYHPGAPAPLHFLELGDCYTPPNSGAYAPYWADNGPCAKLFCRNTVGAPF